MLVIFFSFPCNKYFSQSSLGNVNAVNVAVLMVLSAFNGSYLQSFVRVEVNSAMRKKE